MFTFRTGRQAPITFISLAALVASSGCASLDARDEIDAAAQLSRRVAGGADASVLWRLPVEGESPAWNGVDPLTYDAAVAVALQSNPELRRTLTMIRARRADWVQAGLPPNPTIGFGIGAAVDAMAGAPAFIQGVQMLSWLWKNPHRMSAAEADLRAAVLDSGTHCVDLMARTRTQVAAVIAAQRLLEFDRQFAEIAEHTARLVHDEVHAGELAQLELDRALVDMERARIAVTAAEHGLLQAKFSLLKTMGRPDGPVDWRADDKLPPEWRIPDDELALLQLASTGRLDVAAAGQAVLAAAADLGVADTKRFPEISAMVSWRRNFVDRKAVVPGASITIPILDNGDPSIALQTAKLQAARLDLLEAQETAQAQVRIDLSRLRNARAQVRNLREEQMKAASAAYTRSEAAWKAGEVNLNTLLDTQQKLIRVERDLVRESFAVMEAMCSLRKAVGGSFDAQLNSVPEIDVRHEPVTLAHKEVGP